MVQQCLSVRRNISKSEINAGVSSLRAISFTWYRIFRNFYSYFCITKLRCRTHRTHPSGHPQRGVGHHSLLSGGFGHRLRHGSRTDESICGSGGNGRIEGSFYVGIGYLFLLYGLYRAVCLPSMSVVLTVISLGIRVALAYVLAAIPGIGYTGIWWAVPIGWALADIVGVAYYQRIRQRLYRTAL